MRPAQARLENYCTIVILTRILIGLRFSYCSDSSRKIMSN